MRWCLLFRIMIVLRQSKRAPLYARDTLCAVTGHSRSRHVRPGPRGPWPCISVANPKEENRKKSTQITKHSTRTATHTGGIRRPRRCSVSRRLILPTNVTGYFTYPTDLSICDQCHCAGVRPHTHTHARAPLATNERCTRARLRLRRCGLCETHAGHGDRREPLSLMLRLALLARHGRGEARSCEHHASFPHEARHETVAK